MFTIYKVIATNICTVVITDKNPLDIVIKTIPNIDKVKFNIIKLAIVDTIIMDKELKPL